MVTVATTSYDQITIIPLAASYWNYSAAANTPDNDDNDDDDDDDNALIMKK